MIKKAIRMNLYPGAKAEYQKRHDELWPEMREMLKEHGVLSYSIFLDSESNQLFGYLEIEDEEKWNQVSTTAIMMICKMAARQSPPVARKPEITGGVVQGIWTTT